MNRTKSIQHCKVARYFDYGYHGCITGVLLLWKVIFISSVNKTTDFKGRLRHICEVCGRTEILTPQEAYDLGWDYPPMMGSFGIVSPRTCPNCRMMDTVWAALVLQNKTPDELNERQKLTIERIVSEPESILVGDAE